MCSIALDDQAILGWTMVDGDNRSSTGRHFQPDELVGPELAFCEAPPSGGEYFLPAYPLGRHAIGYLLEEDLRSLLPTPNRTHRVGTVPHVDDRLWLEELQVLGLDVQTEETIEPVGFTQTAQRVSCLSRGIRLQR